MSNLLDAIANFSKFKKKAFFGRSEDNKDLPVMKVLSTINVVLPAAAFVGLAVTALFIPALLSALFMPLLLLFAATIVVSVTDHLNHVETGKYNIAEKIARAECFVAQSVLAPFRLLAKGVTKIAKAAKARKERRRAEREFELEAEDADMEMVSSGLEMESDMTHAADMTELSVDEAIIENTEPTTETHEEVDSVDTILVEEPVATGGSKITTKKSLKEKIPEQVVEAITVPQSDNVDGQDY